MATDPTTEDPPGRTGGAEPVALTWRDMLSAWLNRTRDARALDDRAPEGIGLPRCGIWAETAGWRPGA